MTAADLAAHQIIKAGLARLTPDIPLLSEEDPPAWDVRQHWQRYWLVDPLDGTKEFLNRNGEFTVNIALIDQGEPVLGVVYVPVTEVMYSAANGQAWKEECGRRMQIQVRDAQPPLVVVSRSHSDAELEDYLSQLGSIKLFRWAHHLNSAWWRKGKRNCTRVLGQLTSGIRRLVMPSPSLPGRKYTIGRERHCLIPHVNLS